MATWSHERLLRRPQTPQTKDSLRRRTRDVQDPSGPYLQREPLLGQTLREQSRPRGVAGTEEEPGIIPEAGREGQEATGGRSPRAPLSPLPASRTAVSTWRPCDGVLREPLYHVPTMCLPCAYHVPTMCLPCAVEEPGLARPAKRGTRSAAERDEFRRAAWRASGVRLACDGGCGGCAREVALRGRMRAAHFACAYLRLLRLLRLSTAMRQKASALGFRYRVTGARTQRCSAA